MDRHTIITSAQVGSGMPFAKGHGTGNDFVIVPDPDGKLDLPAEVVAALCDRRRGLGGDGLLRIVRATAAGLDDPRAEWFMDYRNADGSLAEMCGNGVRVYARYLAETGLAAGPRIPILTRAGLVVAQVGADVIAVDMPLPAVGGTGTARLSDVDYSGTVAVCGNPNLVCLVADPDRLDLREPPILDPATFPDGANVEFVAPVSDRRVRMRVVERGVGETLSCGSGACAVAAVVLAQGGHDDGRRAHVRGVRGHDGTVLVDVPGGQLSVTLDGDRCVLAGPAVIVAAGTVTGF